MSMLLFMQVVMREKASDGVTNIGEKRKFDKLLHAIEVANWSWLEEGSSVEQRRSDVEEVKDNSFDIVRCSKEKSACCNGCGEIENIANEENDNEVSNCIHVEGLECCEYMF